MAASRVEERAMAMTGKQDYAPSYFEHNESVLNAGVLLSIPALISQGLSKAFNVYSPLPSGFYGLQHMLQLLCFMALCRIKNPEQLKKYPPGEWGKLLGLDRIPEVGYFRKKINQIVEQSKTDMLQNTLFLEWTSNQSEFYFYIDGHVRVYHGSKANLPKRFVSREKLCLNGSTDFWINDQQGMPLMVITAELNEKLKTAIVTAIKNITEQLNIEKPKDGKPSFTLIFDREAYEPAWFKYLLKKYNVAVITYRKNVKDKWAENLFQNTEIQILNNSVTVQLCELGTSLNNLWFREIRKKAESGHQTAILTTHPHLSKEEIAEKMFSRWTQENFFKYMNENFDFDRMIEYGFEDVSPKKTIPNPEYNKLNYQLKKCREKKRRLQARVFSKIETIENLTVEKALESFSKKSDLLLKIDEYEVEIKDLLEQRSKIKPRIKIEEMPEDKKYNKLKTESKKLKNAILMIAYRAETSLYNTMNEFYKNNKKDGRMVLKEIFTSDADIIPDYDNKTLTIRLHSLSNKRYNEVAEKLCDILNETKTPYPNTELILNYKTVAF